MDISRETIGLLAAWYAVFVVSTALHEAAHAWAALKLGDITAYLGGQVTPNPLPHMEREPVGMIIVPIITFLANGWMMGWASAPYDPYWALRYPRRAALMALAGPAANLVLVGVAGVCIRVGLAQGWFVPAEPLQFHQIVTSPQEGVAYALATLLSILFMLNLVLFSFNLLPLPPLDGSAALALVLPGWMVARYQDFMRQPMFMLMGLFVAWQVFGRIFVRVLIVARGLLFGIG